MRHPVPNLAIGGPYAASSPKGAAGRSHGPRKAREASWVQAERLLHHAKDPCSLRASSGTSSPLSGKTKQSFPFGRYHL